MSEDTGNGAEGHVRGRELTIASILSASIVAAIMGLSYPYMVLKLGFGPNVSVVSAFFGFIILRLIASGSYDRWQNTSHRRPARRPPRQRSCASCLPRSTCCATPRS